MHELGFYYFVEAKDLEIKDFEVIENDKGVEKSLKFKWIDIDDLVNHDVRPKILFDRLQNTKDLFHHIRRD